MFASKDETSLIWWRGDDTCRHEMEGQLLLDVVIRMSVAVPEMFAGEDEALLVWWRGDDICRHEMEGRLLLGVVI